jgi:hypothetical protein
MAKLEVSHPLAATSNNGVVTSAEDANGVVTSTKELNIMFLNVIDLIKNSTKVDDFSTVEVEH